MYVGLGLTTQPRGCLPSYRRFLLLTKYRGTTYPPQHHNHCPHSSSQQYSASACARMHAPRASTSQCWASIAFLTQSTEANIAIRSYVPKVGYEMYHVPCHWLSWQFLYKLRSADIETSNQ